MILSSSSSHFPYVSIHVQVGTPENIELEFDIEPLVDTGFDGGLAVPRDLIPDSVTSIGQSVWKLADDTEIATFSYFGYISIGQLERFPVVVIALAEEPLLGRQATNRFRVTFDHGHTPVFEP